MKRRFICLALAMVLVGVTGFVIFLAVTRDPVNETNFDKIQLDMTKTEVQAILGRETSPELVWGANVWHGRRKVILVSFDNDGLVLNKDIRERGGADEDMIDKFRRWLRLD